MTCCKNTTPVTCCKNRNRTHISIRVNFVMYIVQLLTVRVTQNKLCGFFLFFFLVVIQRSN